MNINMRSSLRQKYLFLLMFLSATGLFAQTGPLRVTGVVTDSLTNETLPFASVFFAGTTYGTTSDKEGNYSLSTKAPGTYDLVISFLGYETFYRQILLDGSGEVQLNVALVTEARNIGGVVVTAKKDEKWRNNLETFKRAFLGNSENAEQCKILNEEVLNFDYDPNEQSLEAYAGEPLIIENKALGYRISYLLEDFRILYKYNYTSYYGFTSFKEMGKESKPKKRWVRNREKSYNGSMQHFFKAVFESRVEEEGFVVNAAWDLEGGGRALDPDPVDLETLLASIRTGAKRLNFDNYLYVAYKNEDEPPGYYNRRSGVSRSEVGRGQLSWMRLFDGVNGIDFESNGYLINPLVAIVDGYWGYEKVAELVPSNYSPTEAPDKE